MIRVVHPGSRIRMLTIYSSRIPHPGVKKAPDHGSRIRNTDFLLNFWSSKPYPYPNLYSLELLDPDPYRDPDLDSMNRYRSTTLNRTYTIFAKIFRNDIIHKRTWAFASKQKVYFYFFNDNQCLGSWLCKGQKATRLRNRSLIKENMVRINFAFKKILIIN